MFGRGDQGDAAWVFELITTSDWALVLDLIVTPDGLVTVGYSELIRVDPTTLQLLDSSGWALPRRGCCQVASLVLCRECGRCRSIRGPSGSWPRSVGRWWNVLGVLMRLGGEMTSPSFDAFYRAYRSEVAHALSLTLRDPWLGGEAADEAMVRAWERWRSVEKVSNPAGWVYRVGLNWARSRLRRRWREVLGDAPDTGRLAPMPGDVDVERALTELSVSHRAVVVLRYYSDWRLKISLLL
ncbi:MAG TPA: hypothetical protein ENH00_00230 [Actinobacteria bacterium]|nr:hypothetical protein [Actinomycetota bacterium]